MVKNSPANAGDARDMDSSLSQEEPQDEGTPVILPGESHGLRSLPGCGP